MPHLIIEHSVDISKDSIVQLGRNIQSIMNSHEGNYDANQCKVRAYSFEEYLVGSLDQTSASFIHITLKALSGRSLEIQKNLAAKISEFSKNFYADLNLTKKRCDISIDMVEMERDTYQKSIIEK